jgi:hypothetical protein
MRLMDVLLGAAAVMAFVPQAIAEPITYDFSVSPTTGPLAGVTANGSFTYDSSSIVLGGGNFATGLLTSLSFTWDGITYDQTTANTGDLYFDGTGNLIGALFGTKCFPATCAAGAGFEAWVFAPNVGVVGQSGNGFAYSTPTTTTVYGGAATLTPVPEPSSIIGLLTILVLMGALCRPGFGRA